MKELKKLEELLRSVMDALSKMATRLPEEFINSQELSGLDFQDLFKDLEEIQKKLMAGDLSGALEAAQRLLQALSEMVANLWKGRGPGRDGSLRPASGGDVPPVGRARKDIDRAEGDPQGDGRDRSGDQTQEWRRRLKRGSANPFPDLEELLRAAFPVSPAGARRNCWKN